MLVFPATVDHLPSDTFFDPWPTDTSDTPFVIHPPQQTPNNPNNKPNTSNSGTNSGSGSDDGGQREVNAIDDRKQRRMISNRESARRSRMRKQKHLENLRNLVNRQKSGNRELTNRLRFVIQQEQILRRENEGLRSELEMLRQKLWDFHQVMRVWELPNQLLSGTTSSSAWPCNNIININNVTSFNEQINQPSLIK